MAQPQPCPIPKSPLKPTAGSLSHAPSHCTLQLLCIGCQEASTRCCKTAVGLAWVCVCVCVIKENGQDKESLLT